jgi:hypothetical protein
MIDDLIQSFRDGWRVLQDEPAVLADLAKFIVWLGPLILVIGVLMTSFMTMEPTP